MTEISADRPSAFLETSPLSGGRRIPIVSFSGYEALNGLYYYDVTLDLAADEAEAPDLLLAPATLILEAWKGRDADVEERRINGIISAVSVSVGGDDDGTWQITVVPSLWRLTQSRVSRIFQDMSVKDVISDILNEDGNIPYSFKLNGGPATEPRKYCTQYQETNFDFVLRLLEEEGLFFSFEQGQQDTVVIRDGLAKLPDAAPLAVVPWETAGAASSANKEKVHRVEARQNSEPQQAMVRDFNYETPGTELVGQSQVQGGGVGIWREYRTTGAFRPPEVEGAARVLGERSTGGIYNVCADTSCRSIAAGTLFKIAQDQQHPELPFALDQKSLAALSVSCGYTHGNYSASVFARPSDLPWRPRRTVGKPVISGLQTAFVVGEGGNEVMTDEMGRVKILFHWDKDYTGPEGATSCWVRVAQAFAGADHGTYFVPKVGDEVVVAFEEGDPDRPLVVGSVFNADHEFPLDIGDQDKRAIFRTSQGFVVYVDDNDGSQELFVQSPTDKHNFVFMAGKEIKVEANDKVSVTGKKQIDVTGSDKITVTADKPIKMSGMDNITIEGTGAGSITIKQGGGKFMIDTAGNVTIEGIMVTIKASANLTIEGAIIKLN